MQGEKQNEFIVPFSQTKFEDATITLYNVPVTKGTLLQIALAPALVDTDKSAAAGLAALGFPSEAIRLVDSNNSYGNNLEDTSLLALYRVMAEFSRLSGPAPRIMEAAEGNQRLPEAMANALAHPLRLNR